MVCERIQIKIKKEPLIYDTMYLKCLRNANLYILTGSRLLFAKFGGVWETEEKEGGITKD